MVKRKGAFQITRQSHEALECTEILSVIIENYRRIVNGHNSFSQFYLFERSRFDNKGCFFLIVDSLTYTQKV
jgi:hypothetical protein